MNYEGKKLAELAIVDEGERYGLFPLQTIQSMAERWGVERQTVMNWVSRHNDFPKEIEGLIEKTARTPKVYPLYEIERYEKLRGLK